MIRALAVALLLAGCAEPIVVEKPVMAPVDSPRAPKGSDVRCERVAWPAITLPTTEAEQIAGRHADRALADAALEECDGRRARAVRAFRRGTTK